MLLGGCNMETLPKGDIGAQEKTLLLTATGLMPRRDSRPFMIVGFA